MISILVFIFVLGLLIVVHEFGHFWVAKKLGVRVEKFSLGFGRTLFSKEHDGTLYSINAIPLGGFVKLAGDNLQEYKGNPGDYLSKPPRARAAIIFFGPFLNYLLGFLCFWMIFFVGYPTLTTKVGGLIDGYGAQSAGIIAGDKIIAVDGKRVLYWDEVQKYIQAKNDASVIRLSILRNDQEFDIDVNIKAKQVNDILGQKHNVGLVGIRPAPDVVILRHGFWKSFSLGLNKTWELTELTYKALWRMLTGRLSFKESVTGPLGIFYITSEAAHIGFIAVAHLLAVLSISLAIFNLLPLPVLDGGHILLLAIEKIRGRALSLKAEQIVSNVGFTLIICLAVFATYNDIMRLFGDKISGFFK